MVSLAAPSLVAAGPQARVVAERSSGVRLLAVTADVVDACRVAQRGVRVAMLCPTRLPRPARTQGFDRSPRPLGATGFRGGVEIGYGVEGDTSGEPLSFNDPRGFLHVEISLAVQPLPGGVVPARLGGRRGLLAVGRPGSFQGPYFANHTRFFFRRGGVRYVVSLHTFGEPETRRLLGRIVQALVPVRSLAAPSAPADAVATVRGARAGVAAGGVLWVAASGSFSSPTLGASSLVRVDLQAKESTPVAGIGDRTLSSAYDGGMLWVTHTRNSRDGLFVAPTLSRLDVSTGQTVSHRLGDRRDTVTAVAVGGGSVWVGIDRLGRTPRPALVRVDPVTLQPVSRTALAVSPGGLTVVGTELWVLPRTETAIVRISAKSGRITGRLHVGRAPSGIVYEAGSVWVTDQREGVVRRLDPVSGAIRSTTSLGGPAVNLTAGPAGIWAPIPGRGEVVLVDAVSAAITRRIDVGGDPTLAIETDGALQVADNSDGWLRRIELSPPTPTIAASRVIRLLQVRRLG